MRAGHEDAAEVMAALAEIAVEYDDVVDKLGRAALAWTEHLRIGLGISPIPLRNVAVTAMEIATIERMFPGRFYPGLGHGVLPWMEQAGVRAASPLTLMREYLPVLRSLLAGEEVTVSGRYVTLDRVRLDWPPETALPSTPQGRGPRRWP